MIILKLKTQTTRSSHSHLAHLQVVDFYLSENTTFCLRESWAVPTKWTRIATGHLLVQNLPYFYKWKSFQLFRVLFSPIKKDKVFSLLTLRWPRQPKERERADIDPEAMKTKSPHFARQPGCFEYKGKSFRVITSWFKELDSPKFQLKIITHYGRGFLG